MGYWMYHTLTGSVYPVPTTREESVAHLADTLGARIYFEAELTTQPVENDGEYWVKDPADQWTRFDEKPESLPEGCELYTREFREAEVFLVPVPEDG